VRVLADGADQVAQPLQHRPDRLGQLVAGAAGAVPLRDAEIAVRYPARDRRRHPGRLEEPADQEAHDHQLRHAGQRGEFEHALNQHRARLRPRGTEARRGGPEQNRDDAGEQRGRDYADRVQTKKELAGDGGHRSWVRR
jgi:hypothetical protein